MNTPNKELLKSIYGDSEKFEAAVAFAEFWNNRAEILLEILSEEIEKNFNVKLINYLDNELFRWEINSEEYYVFAQLDGDKFAVGFVREKKRFKKK